METVLHAAGMWALLWCPWVWAWSSPLPESWLHTLVLSGSWGVQGLFLSHSNADLLSVTLPVCLHPSSFLWGDLSVFCSHFSLGEVFMGLSHLSGAVFQLNARLFLPSMQVSFYKKTHKIFSFPWTLLFGFLGSLPSLHVHLCEPCLSWLLWSSGWEAATTSWSKNGLGRVVAYTRGPLLFCASGAGE